jgi:hypothetical protein
MAAANAQDAFCPDYLQAITAACKHARIASVPSLNQQLPTCHQNVKLTCAQQFLHLHQHA